jgi:hypothetical protein
METLGKEKSRRLTHAKNEVRKRGKVKIEKNLTIGKGKGKKDLNVRKNERKTKQIERKICRE